MGRVRWPRLADSALVVLLCLEVLCSFVFTLNWWRALEGMLCLEYGHTVLKTAQSSNLQMKSRLSCQHWGRHCLAAKLPGFPLSARRDCLRLALVISLPAVLTPITVQTVCVTVKSLSHMSCL